MQDHPFYSIPFFFLMYNIGDFLGKFIPARFTSASAMVNYFISLCFPLWCAYYYKYLYYAGPDSILRNRNLKAFLLILAGLINGYNTNNIFCNAITRQQGANKGTAGFLCVLFLLLGIIAANFHNIFY